MVDDSDDKSGDRFGVTDEMRALADVRSALEAVEREQGRVLQDRRGLRTRLEGLLDALREDALVLCFDADRELVGARGPVEEQLGVSAAELVSSFEEFADDETVEALDEANRAALDEESSGASVSDGFLRSADEDLAVTWIHLRRWDDGGELCGTEVIGLVAPLADPDDAGGTTGDPFENLLEQLSGCVRDDVSDAAISRAVESFGDFLAADRVVINRYDDGARSFSVMSSWLRGDTRPLDAEVRGISISELPWAYSALSAGEPVVVSDAADLPADAAAERALYANNDDTKASLLVPLVRNERLTGFMSIQSTRAERHWGEADVSRARKFAMVLSAALARAEVEETLAGVRSDLEEATAKSGAEEARAGDAEARAKEAQRELESVRREAEEACSQRDALKEEAESARAELDSVKEDADRAQRRVEDTAADALVVRTELEDLRAQVEEARREAAESRAELRQLRDVGAMPADGPAGAEIDMPEPETIATDQPEPAEPRGYDPDATVETGRENLERAAFDPDATLEIEPLSVEADETRGDEAVAEANQEQGGDTETATEAAEAADGEIDPEATLEVQLPSRLREPDSEDLPRAVSLDEMLERTQAGAVGEPGPASWKADKASWEEGSDDVALPEFLDTDDEEGAAEDAKEADAEAAGEGADERSVTADDVEEAGGGGVSGDVEAARQLARQVAGKDGGNDVDAEETAERDAEPPPVILPDTLERPIADLDAIDEPSVGELAAPDTQVPDLAGIDASVGLEDVGGNVELYRDLLAKFRNDYIGAAAKIGSAIEKGNIEVAHLLLHAVKGVARILGAMGVRDAADDLETQLIGNDPAGTRKAVEDFTAALTGVLDSIATLDDEAAAPVPSMQTPSAPAPEAHVSDPMVLRSYLSGLRQHLLAEKLRQCQLVMREITARNWPGDYNGRVVRLAGLIEEGRFEDARASFEDLMGRLVEN